MLEINNKTKSKLTPKDRALFIKLTDKVLGKKYELSLVICADQLSKRINKEYRHKDKVANVLSFPLSRNMGEIFLNIRRANKEAPSFKRSPAEHLLALYIHGLLHIKGLDHGPKMEKEEEKLRQFTS